MTIRLIDPPLHEFLPDLHRARGPGGGRREREERRPRTTKLLAAVERLHESNPMLGLRGVRLGLTVPGLFAMQVRAIAEAIAAAHPGRLATRRSEIMVPLVGSVMELHLIRDEADARAARGRRA